jgi:hypothetical protein
MTQPVLRVVRGDPTPEELAVVTALVTTASGSGTAETESPRHGRWNDPAWQVRRPLRPGPGAWRAAVR